MPLMRTSVRSSARPSARSLNRSRTMRLRLKPVKKRKSTKTREIFDCVVCCAKDTVTCKIDRNERIGMVECSVPSCRETFHVTISEIDDKIDVIAMWADHCETMGKDNLGENFKDDGPKRTFKTYKKY